MKKYQFTTMIALCFILVFLLVGCSTRPPNQEVPPETISQDDSSKPEEGTADLFEPEEKTPEPVEVLGLDDPEKVQQATEIVKDLLDRAQVCDNIYRGELPTDENMPATSFDGEEYRLVSHGEFVTTDDIKAYWSNTFTAEPTSSGRYDTINQRKTYLNANGELYVHSGGYDQPLTVCEWNLATLKLMKFTDELIEIRMESTVAGADAGENTLLLKQSGGTWRLTDSYFLD